MPRCLRSRPPGSLGRLSETIGQGSNRDGGNLYRGRATEMREYRILDPGAEYTGTCAGQVLWPQRPLGSSAVDLMNLSAHGMKYFQFGPSVWPPSCCRHASCPSRRSTLTPGIFSRL